MSRIYKCFPESKKINFDIGVITGVYRSGKTFAGTIVGSFNHVEHIDEPWLPWTLPVMHGRNLIATDFAKDMFRSYTEELFYELIALRQGSLKPFDLSSYWKIKTKKEILHRLKAINSRKDAEIYSNSHNSMLLYNLGGLLPFSTFINETFPKSKIVNIVRNGFHVAKAVMDKQWFSNASLKKPFDSHLFTNFIDTHGEIYYLPWWVEENYEAEFLKLNDFSRGLYFWTRILEMNNESVDKLRETNQLIDLKLEDIIEKPDKSVEILEQFFNRSRTKKTQDVISSIYNEKNELRDFKNPHDIKKTFNVPDDIYIKSNLFLEKFNYV